MDKKYEKAKEKLKQFKQEHLLIWYDKLIEQKREELLNQILKIYKFFLNFFQFSDVLHLILKCVPFLFPSNYEWKVLLY